MGIKKKKVAVGSVVKFYKDDKYCCSLCSKKPLVLVTGKKKLTKRKLTIQILTACGKLVDRPAAGARVICYERS